MAAPPTVSAAIAQGIRSIAIPPLGCGNGGLEWNVVRPLIEEAPGGLDGSYLHCDKHLAGWPADPSTGQRKQRFFTDRLLELTIAA